MSEWHIEVGGKAFHVTAEPAPNGKIAVRANGRIVAPPQPPDRIDCRFHLGTDPFHLTGNEQGMRLEPVAVVEAPREVAAAVQASIVIDPPFMNPLDLRAAVFIVVGAIIFLVSSCTYVGALRPRFGVEERAMVASDPQLRNIYAINSAIRFAFVFEAGIGLLAVAGGAFLIRRFPYALNVMDVAAWSIVAGALLSFLLVDVFAHRQVDLLEQPDVALRFLHFFHTISYFVLTMFALVSGALSSFLDRKAMTELI